MTDTTPAFLITTEDTLSEADADQLRADVHIAPRPLPLGLTAGMTIAAAILVLAGALEQLLASRIVCVMCAGEAHARGSDGAVPVNLANVIASGNGVCFAHIQFAAGPVMPGQTASGIYLPGAGV